MPDEGRVRVSFLCGRVGTDVADSARECSRGAIGARQLAVLEKKNGG